MRRILAGAWVRLSGVILGAVLITALGIDAADTLRGADGTLLSQVIGHNGTTCPSGMQAVDTIPTLTCIDIYEAAPSEDCPHATLTSTLQSEQNITSKNCHAVSVSGKYPWTYVSLPQAQRACASAGKRLPTPDEWYRISLGTQSEHCVIAAKDVGKTGEAECVSAVGAYDLVGNVWEWVDAQVTNNIYDGRELPETGHVTSVDADGVAVTTDQRPDMLYGEDYFWSKIEGVSGIIRGGFYASNEDAGLYALNASVPTNFAAQGVGFRCVR